MNIVCLLSSPKIFFVYGLNIRKYHDITIRFLTDALSVSLNSSVRIHIILYNTTCIKTVWKPSRFLTICPRTSSCNASHTCAVDNFGRNRYAPSRYLGTQPMHFLNRGMQILSSCSSSLFPELRLSLLSSQRDYAPRHLACKLPTFNSTKFFTGMRFGNSDFTAQGMQPLSLSLGWERWNRKFRTNWLIFIYTSSVFVV